MNFLSNFNKENSSDNFNYDITELINLLWKFSDKKNKLVRNSLALTIFKLNSKKINDNHFFTTIIEALELIELGINNKFSNLFVKTHLRVKPF